MESTQKSIASTDRSNMLTTSVRFGGGRVPAQIAPRRTSAAWFVLLCANLTTQAFGQVSLDGSLGRPGDLAGPSYRITADLGRQVGANLFHSFSYLSLTKGDTATFSGPSDVQNILARVTGGQVSSIDGKIQSTIPGANFFLVNPSGVVFGPNASLDVSGSFTVSTADYLKLGERGRFDAKQPGASVLTSAPVESFGFLGPAAGAIQVKGSRLATTEGKGFGFVGGDVEIKGAQITAVKGLIQILSVADEGELPASPGPDVRSFAKLGSITVAEKALVDSGSGQVFVRGGHLIVDDATISAKYGGSIDARTRETMTFQNNGTATIATSNSRGGDLQIETKDLQVLDGSRLSVSTSGSGQAGNIEVEAENVRIRSGSGNASGIAAGTTQTDRGGGQGGQVRITARNLEILSRSRVSSSTSGTGDSGSVEITAGTLLLDGEGSVFEPEISTSTEYIGPPILPNTPFWPGGRAGDITINVSNLLLERGAFISSRTSASSGDAGTVEVMASAVRIDGRDSSSLSQRTGVRTTSSGSRRIPGTSTQVAGNAGRIEIRTGSLEILEGGFVSSSTTGVGNGGLVDVYAETMLIDGRGLVDAPLTAFEPTGIFANTEGSRAGDGGAVVVGGGVLRIVDFGAVSTSSRSTSKAGAITVTCDELTVSDSGRIRSSSSSLGDSGRILVGATGNVFLERQGEITTSSGLSNADGIAIRSGRRIELRNSAITAQAAKDGGSVQLEAPLAVLLIDSKVTSQAGGSGGNILVSKPDLVALVRGEINANAIQGNGGNIQISTDSFLSLDNSRVTASSEFGLEGRIEILGPIIDLNGNLVSLNGSLIGTEAQLPERCAVRLSGDVSSFVVLGKGGLALTPDGWQPSISLTMKERPDRKVDR